MTIKTLFSKLTLLICLVASAVSSANAQNQTWTYTRKISIEYTGEEMVRNVVIPVRLYSNYYDKTATNGADIRFSSNPGIKGDGLSYWIEEWRGDKDLSTIWVKIPLLIKGHNELFFHYGNHDAKPVSDGHDTFLFFDDFEDGDFSDKWDNVSIGEVQERDGMLKLKETDGELGQMTAKFLMNGKMVIRTKYQREKGDQHWTQAGIGGWDHWLCFGDYTDIDGIGTNYLMLFDGESINSRRVGPAAKSVISGIDDKWYITEFWHDGVQVGGSRENVALIWKRNPTPAFSSKLALRTLDNDAWDNFAFISVRPYIDPKQIHIEIGDEKKK